LPRSAMRASRRAPGASASIGAQVRPPNGTFGGAPSG
jgi:hypothetical protein